MSEILATKLKNLFTKNLQTRLRPEILKRRIGVEQRR